MRAWSFMTGPSDGPRHRTMAFGPILAVLVLVACADAQERTRLTVKAFAYNSTQAQTDDTPNEGAWGDVISPGMKVIAVSPDLLDAGLVRGTEINVEGLDGTWTVLDRTASHHKNRIDIYMGVDVDAAKQWGIKEVTISVLP